MFTIPKLTSWRHNVSGLLIFIAIVYAGICLFLYVFQRSLIYFPVAEMSFRPPGTSLMTLSATGSELRVTVLQRDGREALIYFGGNAEDVTASLPELASSFPRHSIYLMHYRGYGGSAGKPTEAGLFADALALFDSVKAEHEDVVVVGRSLGSGVATYLASKRPVARLVLVTPFDSIVAVARQQFGWLPVQWLLWDRFESTRYAPEVSAPTLLIAAEHDEIIPTANSKKLLSSFKPGVAALKIVPETGHNTISMSPDYRRYLSELEPGAR